MTKPSVVTLLVAGALFAVFFANVTMGALGQKPLLGDIPEMLTLFASSVCFSVSVLMLEAEARRASRTAADGS